MLRMPKRSNGGSHFASAPSEGSALVVAIIFVRGNDGSERSEGERMKISVRQTKDSPLHHYYNSCA